MVRKSQQFLWHQSGAIICICWPLWNEKNNISIISILLFVYEDLLNSLQHNAHISS